MLSGTRAGGSSAALPIARASGPSGTLPGAPTGTQPQIRPITPGAQRGSGPDPMVDRATGPIAGAPVALAERPVAPVAAPTGLAAVPTGPTGPAAPVAGPDPTAEAVHRDARFRTLRARQRRFVFTVTPLFLAWYGLFVVLSAFAPSLMRVPVIGSINAGLLLGLAQFVSTLVIVAVYGRFARRRLDPGVRELREAHTPRPEPRPLPAAPDEIWSS